MASKSESMRRWFETSYAAGKGVAEGIDKAKERAAYQDYAGAKADAEAIPAYQGQTEQDKMLADQTADAAIPVDPNDPNAQQELAANQAFQQDAEQMGKQSLAAHRTTRATYNARVQDAKTKMSKWMTPQELQEFDATEAKAALGRFKQGVSELSQMIAMNADPESIAAKANEAYGQSPNGVMGIASVSPENEPVMTFLSESTGNVFGTVPLTDAKALAKMAAYIDQPDKYLEYMQDEKKIDADIKHQQNQNRYWENTTEVNRFKAVGDMLNKDMDLISGSTAANARGAGHLGMKQSEFNSHVDDIRANAEKYGQDKGLSAYDSMNITAKGLDFQIWNQDKIRVADAAANVGIEWHEAVNTSLENVIDQSSGNFTDDQKAAYKMYEDSGRKVIAPALMDMVRADLNKRGMIGNDPETGRISFNAGDGQAMVIPPSVFGKADPYSGVGVASAAVRNGALGVGKFANLPPEVRAQFLDFMANSVSMWDKNAPAPTKKTEPKPEFYNVPGAGSGGKAPPKAAIPTDDTPAPAPAPAPADAPPAKGIPTQADFDPALFRKTTARGRSGNRADAWAELDDYGKYAVKELRKGNTPMSEAQWVDKVKSVAQGFQRGGS